MGIGNNGEEGILSAGGPWGPYTRRNMEGESIDEVKTCQWYYPVVAGSC